MTTMKKSLVAALCTCLCANTQVDCNYNQGRKLTFLSVNGSDY